MKNIIKKAIHNPIGVFAILLFIGALVYLPNIGRFGFYKDDWYLMYDALVKGTSFFTTIFAIDRPARAPLQAALYTLYGQNLLAYHVSALFFRVIGAFAFWKLAKTREPARGGLHIAGALLFLVYPGFLSQPNAVDFHAHIVSLALAMLSLWLTMEAINKGYGNVIRWGLLGFSVLLAWAYLGLMEYFIGIEALRFALIFEWYQKNHSGKDQSWRKLFGTLLVAMTGAVGFLSWRLFFFEGGRKATDITSQLASFVGQPLMVGTRWVIQFGQDMFNAMFGAWVVPFYSLFLPLRLRDQIMAIVLGLAIACVIWFLLKNSGDGKVDEPNNDSGNAWWLLLGLVGAVFPVILANRHIDFADYSRYTLPAMASVILLVVHFLAKMQYGYTQRIVIVFMVFIAGTTHIANSVLYANEATATRNFWWQVAWRLPEIKPGTSLVVSYPDVAIQEDYFVWGPANLIYPHGAQTAETIDVPIEAIVLNPENTLAILAGKGELTQLRRGNQTNADLSTILVISQATSNSCIRVIDGTAPELSDKDRPEIRLVAPASKISQTAATGANKVPPYAFFGLEPDRGWCFDYQKASLARQNGDWQTVKQTLEEGLNVGEYPSDPVEWMPLLQAYSALGEQQSLKPYASIMAESPTIQAQACRSMLLVAKDASMQDYIQQKFCK